MKKVAAIGVVCALLGSAQVVRADFLIAAPPTSDGVWTGSEPTDAIRAGEFAGDHLGIQPAADFGFEVLLPSRWTLIGTFPEPVDRSVRGAGRVAPRAPAADVVREVPPLPSSAGLFLSGMLSLGAWQFARSARHLHLAHLPEWYHAGGPDQIGHAVPLVLDLNASPPCCIEFVDVVDERALVYRLRRELPSRCRAESFLLITAPRGPPIPA